jgi:hypothetical protein
VFTVSQGLLVAGLKYQVFYGWSPPNVFLSGGDQIIGTFIDLDTLRSFNSGYKGWHRHHIVERDTWEALGMTGHVPPYNDQPCVLLPEGGHARRINSILQRYSPSGFSLKARELRQVYADAYDLMPPGSMPVRPQPQVEEPGVGSKYDAILRGCSIAVVRW